MGIAEDKKKLKELSALTKKAAEEMPKTEWKCDECGSINNTWTANYFSIQKYGKIEYLHGICQTCRDRIDKEQELYDKRIKKTKIKEKAKKLLKDSQTPPKVSDSTFESLEIRDGAELAFKTMKRLEYIDRWIYVYGTNNTGKTLLAGAAINDLISKGIPCYYFNERALFRRLKDAMNSNNDETSYAIFKQIKKANIIFWDDFSVLPYTTWEMGTAYDILDFCDSEFKKIIFFSNENLNNGLKKNRKNIEKRLGQRVMARLTRKKKNKDTFYIEMKNKPFE